MIGKKTNLPVGKTKGLHAAHILRSEPVLLMVLSEPGFGFNDLMDLVQKPRVNTGELMYTLNGPAELKGDV